HVVDDGELVDRRPREQPALLGLEQRSGWRREGRDQARREIERTRRGLGKRERGRRAERLPVVTRGAFAVVGVLEREDRVRSELVVEPAHRIGSAYAVSSHAEAIA